MLFELKDVSKSYGKVKALRDLNVAMPEGAIGLLGPNGAGKTTMIRTLLGLIKINSGGGEVLGMDIRRRRLDVRQAVGFVPEDECLFPGVEGVEFVSYAGELGGMRAKDAMQRAHEVLDYVGLGEARYRKVETYSTGMKQRLKIASAIVHDPKMLILDEPTNGMDPAGRDRGAGAGPRPGEEQGDEPPLLQPPPARRRGRLRPRDGPRRRQAPGQRPDRRPEAVPVGRQFEVRVKGDPGRFATDLAGAGVRATPRDEMLVVDLAEGQPVSILWEVALASGEQIRLLRPKQSSLEEVFLDAISLDGA